MLKLIQRHFLKFIALAIIIFPPVAFAANSVIDVLVVYTKGVADTYGGDPTTRFNQVFQVTNQIYKDSNVNLEIRVAKTMMVDYTDDNTSDIALNDITYGKGVFAGVAAAREQAKADMVILYRPYKSTQGSCGIAWVGGQGTNGDFSNAGIKNYMFAHIAINSCGDYVTAHELGHNMGLKHSRKQDGSGGTFPYALGYGIVNQFTTIMAYQSEFNVDYWSGKLYKFSNPELVCKGVPCGIDRTNATFGADAHYVLNITGPQIANFYAAPAVSSSSVNGSSVNSSVSSKASSAVSSKAAGVTSSAKSSVASSANGSLTTAYNNLQIAKANYDAAVAAVAANKSAIEQKTKTEATMKAAFTTATNNLAAAKTAYEAATKKYNTSAALLASIQTKVTTALNNYNKSTTANKEANRKLYNDLATSYNTTQTQVIADFNAMIKAQANVVVTTAALSIATNNYNLAKQATLVEQALTASLAAKLNTAQVAYKNALDTYNLLATKK